MGALHRTWFKDSYNKERKRKRSKEQKKGIMTSINTPTHFCLTVAEEVEEMREREERIRKWKPGEIKSWEDKCEENLRKVLQPT